MNSPFSAEALAFKAALVEVDLEDVLGSAPGLDGLRATVLGDHRRDWPNTFNAAFDIVDRIGRWLRYPPAAELGPADHSSFQARAMQLYAATMVESRRVVDLAASGTRGEPPGAFDGALIEVEVEDAVGRLAEARSCMGCQLTQEEGDRIMDYHRRLGAGLYAALGCLVFNVTSGLDPWMEHDGSELTVPFLSMTTADLYAARLVGLIREAPSENLSPISHK